jgi:hypothetical protein
VRGRLPASAPIDPQRVQTPRHLLDHLRERGQASRLEPGRQRRVPGSLDLRQVRPPEVRSPTPISRDRKLGVDRLAEIDRLDGPSRLDKIKVQIEQISRLCPLDQGPDLLGNQLGPGYGRDREGLDAPVRDVEVRLANGLRRFQSGSSAQPIEDVIYLRMIYISVS